MEISNYAIYFLIFLSKILELAMITLRMILTARDEKLMSTFLCFLQSALWVISTATVVTHVTEDPGRMVAYVLGCSVGCYVGMVLDEKLAMGQNMLTVIIDATSGEELVKDIRTKGFAVTVVKGKGMEKEKLVLMIATKRKKKKELTRIIKEKVPNAMVIYETIDTVGGYL